MFSLLQLLPLLPQAALFDRAAIPWQELAFPTGRAALRHYFDCIDAGGIITPLQRIFRSTDPR